MESANTEFASIFSTFELVDCIVDDIENTMEFLENSCIDILED